MFYDHIMYVHGGILKAVTLDKNFRVIFGQQIGFVTQNRAIPRKRGTSLLYGGTNRTLQLARKKHLRSIGFVIRIELYHVKEEPLSY